LISGHYGNSPVNLLRATFPELTWKSWKFKRISSDNDDLTDIQYLEWLKEKLNVQEMDDWYNLSRKHFYHTGGFFFYNKYGNVHNFLTAMYPTHHWDTSKYARKMIPKKAQRTGKPKKKSDELRLVGFKTLAECYKITREQYKQKKNVFGSYSSPEIAIMKIFNKHSWVMKKFKEYPKTVSTMKNLNEMKKSIKLTEIDLEMKSLNGWYKVKKENLKFLNHPPFKGHGRLKDILPYVYPEHPWIMNKFVK